MLALGIVLWIAFCAFIVAICTVAKQGDRGAPLRVRRSGSSRTLSRV